MEKEGEQDTTRKSSISNTLYNIILLKTNDIELINQSSFLSCVVFNNNNYINTLNHLIIGS